MTLREQVELRRAQWEEFNRWEEEQPPTVCDPEAVMADIGWLWRLVPPEFRLVDPDPEKEGSGRGAPRSKRFSGRNDRTRGRAD